METDSDSDGSHVSSTPPRHSNPPPPPPPQQHPPVAILKSAKSKIRVEAPSRSKTKRPSKPKTSEPEPPRDTRTHTPLPTNLPFQIRRQFTPSPSISVDDSLETLPAGFFSKHASFSKFRKSDLNFENDQPVPPPLNLETAEIKSEALKKKPPNPETADFKSESLKKKRPPINLVTVDAPLPPVKVRKSNGEGNFVKLNLRGNKHKFVNKLKNTRNSSQSYSGRKSYRSKRKFIRKGTKSVIDEEKEENDLINEAVVESQKKKGKIGSDLIDEAVRAVRNEVSDENLVSLLKLVHGYDSYRDGQLEAIKLVLDGKSTMLVLPTGAGKSLCYQIPAMVLPGLTLVVSPLVALMIDQLKQLPHAIRGGLLSSTQSPEEVAETLRQLQEGTIKVIHLLVLFVSPEKFLNPEFLSTYSATSSISLIVVDEAHCISEWSHNFRPSYLRLRASLLRAKFNVGCILAMTATATTTTLHAVMSALEIPLSNFIQKGLLRDNLQLSVSLSGHNRQNERSADVDQVFSLHRSPEHHYILQISVFQYETDQISKYLCDYNISSKSYHSGIPAKDRRRVQELFCSNKIRVVVATVAFGMGLDKSDVGAENLGAFLLLVAQALIISSDPVDLLVIHYSLPGSLEEYVQEIGRAGRDGRLSYCHLFFDDLTYFKLRSLMHSEGADEYAINKFLCQVFADGLNSRGKLCSLVKESTSRKFDLKEEVMHTLLTRMELGEVQYLRLLPQLNANCTLNFHKTVPTLLADKDIVVAAIIKKSETKKGQFVFDIPTVANSIGATAVDVSNHLQNLKLKGEVTYELKDPAFCYRIVEIPSEFCSLSAHLTKWLSEVESCKVSKLDTVVNAAVFAMDTCDKMHGCCGAQHTPCLQKKISDYFNGDYNCHVPNKIGLNRQVFLQSNLQAKFTPRAVARIMHGIGSPAYPSTIWSKTHFWGRYTQIDFQAVMEAARAELLNVVGKEAV
ncbi:hypothetical protein EZV62_017414 [Acer yangbiense]|uniref:DNA 3'-5' helicase n=1 Tax=Acer yangbiense TaxID=1000413 RepID=A0A5C7HGJ8_9ROSI|nr:hypothetical protein EZV62_017414 [Acer yangbiense]